MESRARDMTWLDDTGFEADRFALDDALRSDGIEGIEGIGGAFMLEKDGVFWYCRRTPWAGLSGSPRPGGMFGPPMDPEGRSDLSFRSISSSGVW